MTWTWDVQCPAQKRSQLVQSNFYSGTHDRQKITVTVVTSLAWYLQNMTRLHAMVLANGLAMLFGSHWWWPRRARALPGPNFWGMMQNWAPARVPSCCPLLDPISIFLAHKTESCLHTTLVAELRVRLTSSSVFAATIMSARRPGSATMTKQARISAISRVQSQIVVWR